MLLRLDMSLPEESIMLETTLMSGTRDTTTHLYLKAPLALPDGVTADFAASFGYTGPDRPLLYLRSANCPQISKAGKRPASLIPGDSNNFLLTATVTLSGQNAQILFGNLRNGTGSGTFWITLNNTYIASTLLSIDGYDTSGNIWRARFGTGKLTINTPHTVRLERKAGMLTCTIDGVAYPAVSMPKGFSLTVVDYPLYLGNSVDSAFPLGGTVIAFDYTVYV